MGKEMPCSAGLHPWYLQEATLADELHRLRLAVQQPNVLAVGECGLDKITDTPFALQEKAFTAQVATANEHHKPLIIHCVRAFDELLHLLKRQHSIVPVIIHGFNKKAGIAQKLLDAGCYLSFGKALLASATAGEAFLQTPDACFFLETDDTDSSIQEIYSAAAALRKTTVETIISHTQNNFKKIFGI